MNAPGAARRRTTAGAILVAAALLTSACAAGRVAQTADQKPSIGGVNANVGSIGVRNLLIQAPTQGASFPKGSTLKLTVVLVNNGTSSDLLTNISSSAVSGWGAYSSVAAGNQVAEGGPAPSPAPQASRTVRIPNGSRTSFGVPSATGSLLVTGTKATVRAGNTVRMTLTFARAGTVSIAVPVALSNDESGSTVPAPSGSASGEGD
ncbi:hypothetical protein [uncultured Jatrophihabitans sp.]|uniref:hypothetical protein n=1 Tax=uncultured Jatrophihabitans sp. TaxID=1610747 RepID=UPI0035CAB899